MIQPVITAHTALIKTAAAAMSLIVFSAGTLSIQTKSIIFSMQVLNSSAIHTIAMTMVIPIISMLFTLKIKQSITVNNVTTMCIRALCSDCSNSFIPEKE